MAWHACLNAVVALSKDLPWSATTSGDSVVVRRVLGETGPPTVAIFRAQLTK